MESLERKDASAGTEEPIKSEGVVPNLDTSERSSSAASPPPNCSICLGKLINTSFTDSCLHQFCFTCLLRWSKIKTECPLCKQTFKSIIHNVRSEEDYDQYHVQYTSQFAAVMDVTADIYISGQRDVGVGVGVPVRPFMYRTTMANNRRYGMLLNPEAVARREQIPSIVPEVSNEERRRRNANPIDYRRNIYRHGVWAVALPDAFGRLRESSAAYYRQNPSDINRLIPWLNRELQVLLNNNQFRIAYVLGVITETITQYDIRSAEFRNIVLPFFGIHTDHFVHEFSNYARTNFDLIGYDNSVTYISNRGLSNEYLPRVSSPTPSTSSSSSSDSDVRVLNDNFDAQRLISADMPSVGPHVGMPGPSASELGAVEQLFRMQLPYTGQNIFTISSTSSSENECEIIGCVKPRHERTPEIIDLSSSETEANTSTQPTSNSNTQSNAMLLPKEEIVPSTSSSCDNANNSRRTRRRVEDMIKAQMYQYSDTPSESNSEETDSDYNPVNTKSRRHKTTSKKVSKNTSRKLRSRKRKKSTGAQRKRDKEPRNRSYSSYGSDDESPQREVSSSSRGKKRHLSKSSDGTDSEKISKKNKKNKKAKSSKKGKKRNTASTSKAPSYIYSSCCSSSSSSDCNSDSEANKSIRRRTKKSSSTNSYRYTSEEPSANEKSSKRSSSTRRTSERKSKGRYVDSDLSDYVSSRRSSSASFDSHKNLERLQDAEETNSRHCTSDEDRTSRCQRSSSSVFSDEVSSWAFVKRKNGSKSATSTTTGQTSSQSSDRSSTTTTTTTTSKMTTTSASSAKSDTSSPTEHSASSKAGRDRHRSHKKRKESKKRRRSHS